MNVLFVVMEFAPVNTTGNFRTLKFIKYLKQFKINPVVVTFPENEGAKYFNAKIDKNLLNEIPNDLPVYRIHCKNGDNLYRNKMRTFITIFFSIKDNLAQRWKKNVMTDLESIIGEHKPKIIYTSLPPFSSGMLAVDISKKFDIPLVIDMRDLWAMWGNSPFGSKIHYLLTLREERKIFTHASAIIGVTPQLLTAFRQSHPGIEKSKYHFISNGFDKEVALRDSFTFSPNKKRIVIGYVGSFYYAPELRVNMFKPWWRKRLNRMIQFSPRKEDWLYRSPYFFLKTVAELFKKYPHYRDVVFIEFVGKKPKWLEEMVIEFNLVNNTIFHGFLPQQDAFEIQKSFDLVLATSEKVIDSEHYCLPSKIFDFVGLNIPILGFVTPGIQRDFLLESGLGIVFNPDDIPGCVAYLKELFINGKFFFIDKQYLQQFSRIELTQKLAEIIHGISKRKAVS